jgi:hypothetical protein
MSHHSIALMGVLTAFVLVAAPGSCRCEGESAMPELSLTSAKDSYAVGEHVEFQIRVDNSTDHEVCFPTALGFGDGYVVFEATDPSGERVQYSCEIVEEFQGGVDDLVFLRPGSFYGVHQRHSPLRLPGEWWFSAKYYGPSSAAFPLLCRDTITSETIAVLVTE